MSPAGQFVVIGASGICAQVAALVVAFLLGAKLRLRVDRTRQSD